jgi:hypothetical protein
MWCHIIWSICTSVSNESDTSIFMFRMSTIISYVGLSINFILCTALLFLTWVLSLLKWLINAWTTWLHHDSSFGIFLLKNIRWVLCKAAGAWSFPIRLTTFPNRLGSKQMLCNIIDNTPSFMLPIQSSNKRQINFIYMFLNITNYNCTNNV